jgi:hypothetical protein
MKLKSKKDKWKIKFEHNSLVKLTSNMKPPIVAHESARSPTNY